MSRLAPLDRALVLILVPIWIVCFAIGVRTQLRGGGTAALEVTVEAADRHPTLTGYFSPFFHSIDPLAEAGLRPGDQLIRVGDADLRGVGTFGLYARVIEESSGSLSVPVAFQRDGVLRETSLALLPISIHGPGLAASFAFAAAALFLLLRGRPTPTVRAFFHFGLSAAFTTCVFPGSVREVHAWLVITTLAHSAYFPMAFRFLFRFPDDRPPESGWNRIWPWLFLVNGPLLAAMFTSHAWIAETGFIALAAVGALTLLGVATHKYRQADRVGRRQMRWVLFGIYCAALPLVLAVVASALDPRLGWLYWASNWARPLVPLFLVVSVWRFNLFDIDRILSAAASYNLLAVLLAGGGLVIVPKVAAAASGLVGIDAATGQVALSMALAAVLIPGHRRLRPQIDRLFFKERYALDHGIAELLPTLSACVDARQLTECVGAGLQRLFRPEACVVYAGVGGSYAPVFAEGAAVPPAFEASSPLIGTLRARHAPLSLSAAGRRPDEAPLGPFDRAALETLHAEVVVPIRQDDALAAFLCVGPKRSGDVYTSTDLSLLTAVAETVSHRLQRFDQEEVIREGRAMQASLRRYVPGAIAEQLSSGTELVSGEREVSVLFVDIRGYTDFAQSRKAEEIFSAVNRYTETVSQIVQRHGGSVVEFNGDGMMAVFGAPRELAHKERAAVEAGCEIVAAVVALPVGDEETLSVGVGIATGEAFVGNIQAVDRMIWSAIGNTTNLAARLQSLTRELDALVVIDAVTNGRAGSATQDFRKHAAVPIRGRRESQDLHVLPTEPG